MDLLNTNSFIFLIINLHFFGFSLSNKKFEEFLILIVITTNEFAVYYRKFYAFEYNFFSRKRRNKVESV